MRSGSSAATRPDSAGCRSRTGRSTGIPGVMINFRVSYKVKQLASKYDKVSVILVRLDDGSFIAATSSIPNDADPELAELAAESLESLRIKE